MAKINLITIHWGCSYGGTMQTYATIKLLKELGHEVTLINLVHPKFKLKNRKISLGSWIITEILFFIFQKKHFGEMTKRMYSINKPQIPKADFTIVGSDQVWNEDITSPINMSYFLDFEDDSVKVSFSSSFGKSTWESDKKVTELVKSQLMRFKALSVREESGVRLCKEVFGQNAVHVLDPTLVYEHYDELLHDVNPTAVIYPFLLINTKDTFEICKTVSKETGLSILEMPKIKNIFTSGPTSWLRRIKSSEFIVTDSFHGLAFSIIFHKRFLVVCANEKKFTRLQSLLTLLNLNDRYIRSVDDLRSRLNIINTEIDYDEVEKVLHDERQKAIRFLKENLGDHR